MSALLLATMLVATPPVVPAERCSVHDDDYSIVPAGAEQPRMEPPYGNALGDVWEMEEVACWRGTWLRRGRSNIFDAYWYHPTGERVRATLETYRNDRSVIVVRRHDRGQYCRYDGVISADWGSVDGNYTCTWERTPMRWHARIVRMPEVLPRILR